jgi:hypothetical protein
MHAAPAFKLHLVPGVADRVALTLIGGITAAVLAAWVWSHFDAAAGLAGRSAWAWAAATVAAAVPGSWLGWRLAPRGAVTLGWDRGSWTLCRPGGEPVAAEERARGVVAERHDAGGARHQVDEQQAAAVALHRPMSFSPLRAFSSTSAGASFWAMSFL